MTRKARILPIAIVIVISSLVYLIGNASVSLWDRDEPRYAQTTKQMLESGDWVVPMLLDEPREKKPVFIYWCQAASMHLFGKTPFAARLPSVIGMTLTLVVLAAVLPRIVGKRRAFWTVFVFATSGLTIVTAKLCITDGVLILFVTAAQLCLYAILNGYGSWPVMIGGGIAVGFGLLTKGPVVPAVILMTLLVLALLRLRDRILIRAARVSPVRLLAAIALAIAIYATWGYPIERRLPGYHVRTIKAEVLDRAAKPQEGHKGPPGYYLLAVPVIFLPWSWLLPSALSRAWKRLQNPQIRFAFAAVVGPWIMFEIVQTKLPHYVLPLFPWLALLTANVIVTSTRLRKVGLFLGAIMLVGIAIIYGLIFPRLDALRISPRVADVLIREGAVNRGDAIMIDYKETSLAFYQGGTIRPQRNDRFLETTPPTEWPKWIVLTDEIWRDTPQTIKDQLEVVASVKGLNYADGMRVVEVIVLRKR